VWHYQEMDALFLIIFMLHRVVALAQVPHRKRSRITSQCPDSVRRFNLDVFQSRSVHEHAAQHTVLLRLSLETRFLHVNLAPNLGPKPNS
jgi:hypothetical protein